MTLVYVEHQDGRPDELSLQAIALAREISGDGALDALLAGAGAAEAAAALGAHGVGRAHVAAHGVGRAHVADHDVFATHAPVALGRCIAELIERLSPAAVLAAGSERGNEVLAHAAAITDLPLAANCIAAQAGDPLTVTRIRWGGSLLEEALLHGSVKLLTVAPHTVAAVQTGTADASVEPFTPALSEADLAVRVVDQVTQRSGGISLADAKFVVSCGRGAGSPEGFAPAERLAALMGGAVGCSRAVTIAGWRSHTDQVGQTGTKIAPEIYIACGVSGATQHLAGAKGAKRILAINTDPEAPIMASADYAVIGDLHEVVPAIAAEIRRQRGAQ
jgi:electron transfer flavoprotein alpha subunit